MRKNRWLASPAKTNDSHVQLPCLNRHSSKINGAATWENRIFAYAKTKTQISFAVTAKLISAFVFATRIVQSLSYLNTKFQASSHFLRRRSLICVGPDRKPRRPVFWRRGSMVRLQTWIYRKVPKNFLTPEIFTVFYLKFKQIGQTLGYFVKMMQME